MDVGPSSTLESWVIRSTEQAVRTAVVALVLTGQMLPSGAASAQEDPPAPTLTVPPTAGTVEKPPEPPQAEVLQPTAVQLPLPSMEDDDALPPAPVDAPAAPKEEAPTHEPAPEPTPAPVEAPTPHEVDAAKTPSEAAPALEVDSLPMIRPVGSSPAPVASGEVYKFGEWTMVIRPGVPAPRPEPFIQSPVAELPANHPQVSVPVSVNINNVNSQLPAWGNAWNSANPYAVPTSAYLFDRPLPYYQLRGDFQYLRPFIRGLQF